MTFLATTAAPADWDTSAEESLFLGSAIQWLDAIGCRDHDKLIHLLSGGVDDSWFLDRNRQTLYQALLNVSLDLSKPGVTVRIGAVFAEAERLSGEPSWVRPLVSALCDSVDRLDLDRFHAETLPRWWAKLKRRSVRDLIGQVDRDFMLPPTADRFDAIDRRLCEAIDRWRAEPELQATGLGPFDKFLADIQVPRPQESFIPTGLACLDHALGGGLSGPGASTPGRVIVVAARPGQGKALKNSEPVLLADGTWKPIGDLSVGEQVASTDGAPSTVQGVFPQGQKQLYRVLFSDGRSVDCCREHLWTVNCPRWDQPKSRLLKGPTRTIQTWELAKYLEAKRYQRRITIDTVQGEFGSPVQSIVHPWLLGVLLGDGCLSQRTPVIANPEQAIIDRARALAPAGVTLVQRGRSLSWGLSTVRGLSNPLLDALRDLDLMGKRAEGKFVPRQFLSGTRQERLDLLRGLMDTDGGVESNGSSALFCSISKQLALDVQYLARSLGGWSILREKQPHYTYKGERKPGQLAYVVNVNIPDNPFWLPRKAEAMKPVADRFHRRPTVLSVQEVDAAAATCITVSHPSHLFVTKDFIVTHNTLLTGTLATQVAGAGHGVLLFSMEMGVEQMVARLTAARHLLQSGWQAGHPFMASEHVTYNDLITRDFRRLTPAAYDRIFDGGHQIVQDNLSILTNAYKPEALAQRMRLHKQRHPDLRLVIVDHLGLLDIKGENRAVAVGEASRIIKTTAVELGVDVLLVSQLNRGVENRENKMPGMADCRDSGNIEQDADLILGLLRPAYYRPDADPREMQIGILKNRQGHCGVMQATVVLDCCAVLDGAN